MRDFAKLAAFLDSFEQGDPDYDLACFIKAKVGKDLQDSGTVNNGEDGALDNNDITMSTAEQQSGDNVEGNLMSDAFKELDVLNQIDEEKEKINLPDPKDVTAKPDGNDPGEDSATPASFGDGVMNQKQASLFDILQTRFKNNGHYNRR